jgi:hypothetical protein
LTEATARTSSLCSSSAPSISAKPARSASTPPPYADSLKPRPGRACHKHAAEPPPCVRRRMDVEYT